MANGKSEKSAAPVATNDFHKENGMVHLPVMPVGPSMTRQEFAAECDINTIMKTYDAFLADPAKSVRQPQYVDFADMPQDLMGFMQVMKDGEAAFMRLPAPVRKEFDNDAVAFVDFAMNPDNLEQIRVWGLAPPAQPAEPVGAPPSASAPGGAPAAAAPAAASAAAGAASTHGST